MVRGVRAPLKSGPLSVGVKPQQLTLLRFDAACAVILLGGQKLKKLSSLDLVT